MNTKEKIDGENGVTEKERVLKKEVEKITGRRA